MDVPRGDVTGTGSVQSLSDLPDLGFHIVRADLQLDFSPAAISLRVCPPAKCPD